MSYKQAYAANAERLIWRALNSSLLIRRSQAKTSGSMVLLASEVPFEHEAYGRVLLEMSGFATRPHSRGTIPLTIQGDSVRGVVGSFRDIRIAERCLYAKPVFASDAGAQAVARKWSDGHIPMEAVALDFTIAEALEVSSGDEYSGWSGPLTVATRWSPIAVRLRP